MRYLLVLLLLFALPSCVQGANPEKLAAANEVTLAKAGITALKVGDKAPAFTADSTTGERVTIGSVGGPRTIKDIGLREAVWQKSDADTYTVLYFYPADFTPNSTKHLLDLSKGLDQLGVQKIKVYGVSTGTTDAHKAYVEKYAITVPLLTDTGAIGKLYGVLLDGGKYPQRTLVGIKPDGTIGFYSRSFGRPSLVNHILKETGRTPVAETAK